MAKRKAKSPFVRLNSDVLVHYIDHEDGWVLSSGRFTAEDDKTPRQRFLKKIARVGRFVKDADGSEFEITPAMLDHWAKTHAKIVAGGTTIRIPNKHENADNAREQMGVVDDLFVDGDSLFMSCELIGQDAIEAASKNDVSLYSPRQWKDGNGTAYHFPIQHVAMCPDPVLTDLGGFVPIAASQRHKQENSVKDKTKKLADALGIKLDDIDLEADGADDTILDLSIEAIAASQSVTAELKKEVTALKKKLDKNPKVSGKDNDEVNVDPRILSLSRDKRMMRIDALAKDGKVDGNAADRLKKAFCEDALELSIKRGEDDSLFDEVMSIFDGNKPLPLGERTGPQSTSFSRSSSTGSGKNGDDSDVAKDAERRAKEFQSAHSR